MKPLPSIFKNELRRLAFDMRKQAGLYPATDLVTLELLDFAEELEHITEYVEVDGRLLPVTTSD